MMSYKELKAKIEGEMGGTLRFEEGKRQFLFIATATIKDKKIIVPVQARDFRTAQAKVAQEMIHKLPKKKGRKKKTETAE